MKIVAIKEKALYEKRIAITPTIVKMYTSLGLEVLIEKGAGESANFSDESFSKAGATLFTSVADTLKKTDILLKVQPTPNKDKACETKLMQKDSVIIGTLSPFQNKELLQEYAANHISSFALELLPRITRAQEMDILSSQSSLTGFRAVIDAANHFAKIFPMLVTSAGTISPAKVLVLGTGVAGLQAIATARKLGAIVHAYDVRPACREQVESLGGKFVELAIDASSSEDKGGYAKAMDENFYRQQRDLMASVVAQSDVVITTAAIPGKPSPRLITADAVRGMPPGGVIIDLAAERGGNCELTRADQRTTEHGITILGPTNIASEVPNHASLMLGNNVVKFLLNMFKKGELNLNREDEIVRDTLVTFEGQVVNERVKSLL